MQKQYVFIEKLDNGEIIRFTFETKKELKDFIELVINDSDFESFEIKTEWIGISL